MASVKKLLVKLWRQLKNNSENFFLLQKYSCTLSVCIYVKLVRSESICVYNQASEWQWEQLQQQQHTKLD